MDSWSRELDLEEMENLMYEEESIPINEVEGSSSTMVDLENFSVLYAHFESSYLNFQNEWRHNIDIY